MTTHNQRFSLDHPRLLDSLLATDKLLIIQDLDGVCMGLVRDPLTRTIERRYVQAAARLAASFSSSAIAVGVIERPPRFVQRSAAAGMTSPAVVRRSVKSEKRKALRS